MPKKPHSTLHTQHSQRFALRPARLEDFEEIYDIFCQILDEGMTYSYTREEMMPERSLAYWMTAPDTHCYVADVKGKVAGIATIRRNRTGRAEHVANASFIVHPDYRRMGIATALGKHALKTAKRLGYRAMQFNFVVSTNQVAVELWQSLGMKIVGTLPEGFRHAKRGYVDVYVMHRFLT
ncbi:MAG: GNAT family N-acetyltransferase [Rickettsiales bacterium]|jgi:L-amino acid N-acyltransferase YncA|nr:GNAT family N-acetyltransferase [Rickettsiales bacterium]